MAYQQQPNRLEYFSLHQWIDTPAAMITSALVQQLDQSGLYASVLSGSADVATDLRLDTQLLRFLQVVDNGSSRMEVELRVNLVRLADRSLLLSEVFRYSEPTAANPVAGVAAANRALQRLLRDLSSTFAEEVHARQPDGTLCPD